MEEEIDNFFFYLWVGTQSERQHRPLRSSHEQHTTRPADVSNGSWTSRLVLFCFFVFFFYNLIPTQGKFPLRLGLYLRVKRAQAASHTSIMCNARLCKVQRFTVAEVMFTKMCNCYFGVRKSLPFCALRPHDVIYQRGADAPRNKWLLEIVRRIQTGTLHSNGDGGVCHARLSVVCGRCVKTASNMFVQPAEIKVEPLWFPTRRVEICFRTQTAHLLQVIFRCRCSGVLQIGQSSYVSGPRWCLLSQRVSEERSAQLECLFV